MGYSNSQALSSAFRYGELLPGDLILGLQELFLEREPAVLAFLPEENLFGRLHHEAEKLARRYPDVETRPPSFGMLVGVKDIFHVDGFTTRAGSRLPARELQGAEAHSVTRLKEAGVLIVGKTVTTEFAYFTPGPTRNPHHPEHTPGGSSSGSAAAVAAGMCDVALGTQTIGSIIRPASFCGVVGFKPTYDRISRVGVIPLSPSLDHVGFFAQEVVTARQVAGVLIDGWENPKAEQKITLGIPEGKYLTSASDYAITCFRATCQALSDGGFTVRQVPVMDDFSEICARHNLIMAAEAARVHAGWFQNYEELYSSKFADLVRRGQKSANSQLQEALDSRDAFREGMTRIMNEAGIDLWISPASVGPAPKGLESTGDPVMNLPWTQIGFPTMSLPVYKNASGLPLGLQLIGKWNADEQLFTAAEEIWKAII